MRAKNNRAIVHALAKGKYFEKSRPLQNFVDEIVDDGVACLHLDIKSFSTSFDSGFEFQALQEKLFSGYLCETFLTRFQRWKLPTFLQASSGARENEFFMVS